MPLDKFDERVRRHAHTLWVKAGKPHGRNDEFWARAHAAITRLVECEDAMRDGAYPMWVGSATPAPQRHSFQHAN